MTVTLSLYRDCTTAGVRPLDLQLIAEMKRLAPGVLSSYDHELIQRGDGAHNVLQTAAAVALHRAVTKRGSNLRINSAYRTVAQQFVLRNHFDNGRCGFRAVAQVGASNHNGALAIDIEDAPGWKRYLEAEGWDWIGSFDPVHFDFEGPGMIDIRPLSVRAFQSLWNLNHPNDAIVADGVFGEGTRSRLLKTSVSGFAKTHVVTETPTLHRTVAKNPMIAPSSETATLSSFGTMRQGASGELVKRVQFALNAHGIPLICDGLFGSQMTEAVKRFQQREGIVADGAVGSITLQRLGLK